MDSVPFKIPDLFGGFGEAHGVARMDDDTLVLEVETRDSLGGFLKSKIRKLQVACSDVASIRYSKSFWGGATIELRGKSMASVSEIPGQKEGAVTLKIRRRHREAAQNLVSSVELKLTEQLLRDLDS